jgi:uncharacterized membrane protein
LSFQLGAKPDSTSLLGEITSLGDRTQPASLIPYAEAMSKGDQNSTEECSRPQEKKDGDLLDKTFDVTLILKGLDGLLELVGGLLLLIISPATLNHLAENLFQHELSQDPNDFIAHHLLRLTANLHHTQLFGAIYLLTHGLVKIIIVIGLLRRERWAYPVAFVFLGGFVIYQIYRLTYAPSAGLALLTAFDLFIIWLTWREYLRMKVPKTVDAAA